MGGAQYEGEADGESERSVCLDGRGQGRFYAGQRRTSSYIGSIYGLYRGYIGAVYGLERGYTGEAHLDEAGVCDECPAEEQQRARGAGVAGPEQLAPRHVAHLEAA